jgi:transposase
VLTLSSDVTSLRKKHSKAEVAAKLVQADDFARQGILQREIAGRLGVSLMTLHRWRKAPALPGTISSEPEELAGFEEELVNDVQNSNSKTLGCDDC